MVWGILDKSKCSRHIYNTDKQHGFALPEVLVAAAIAASVLTATAVGIANTTRLLNNVLEYRQSLGEAQIISARLKAGLAPNAAQAGFANWHLVIEPYETASPSTGDLRPMHIQLQHQTQKQLVFGTIILLPSSDWE